MVEVQINASQPTMCQPKHIHNRVINEETLEKVVKDHVVVECEDPHYCFVNENETIPKTENLLKHCSNFLTFFLNDEEQVIENPDPTMRLVDYIRQKGLTGTKIGCGEGGCGTCTVLMRDGDKTMSINACLKLLGSLEGMLISTIEHIGSTRTGLNPVQKKVAECNGTQCGYCTPGWVMAMQDLMVNDKKPSEEKIENHFDGNICRCTGYRPILAAMHTFKNEDKSNDSKCSNACLGDMEDLSCKDKSHSKCRYKNKGVVHKVKKEIKIISQDTAAKPKEFPLSFEAGNVRFYKVKTLKTVLLLKKKFKDFPHQILVGGTSKGVTKYYSYNELADNPSVFIDVNHVSELKEIKKCNTGLSFGAAVSINEIINTLESCKTGNSFSQSSLKGLVRHLKYVANNQVRNAASWAGNLMINHYHNDFPSDLLTLFSGYGATLNLISQTKSRSMKVFEWGEKSKEIQSDEILLSLFIPFYTDSQTHFDSYKVAKRHNNAHAIVNASFLSKINDNSICKSIDFYYGGVKNNSLFYSEKTINYLVNKDISTNETLQGALQCLKEDLDVIENITSYQCNLCFSFLYKYILSLQKSLPDSLLSAATHYERPISKGHHQYSDADPTLEPVSLPVTKLGAYIQTTGEAEYSDDVALRELSNCLVAYCVNSTIARGTITKIDPSKALQMKGVRDFISAQTLAEMKFGNDVGAFPGDEELFSTGKIQCVGQSIGLIVADTEENAKAAAAAVEIEYELDPAGPILDIDEAIKRKSFLKSNKYQQHTAKLEVGDVETAFESSVHVIEGEIYAKEQYHFSMETQVSVAIPQEDGKMTIYSSAQGPSDVRKTLGALLKKSSNKLTVTTKRLGGSFGGKISRNVPHTCAVAVASEKLGCPVRMQLDRETDMKMTGKRHPFKCVYKVGFDDNGVINSLKTQLYCDGGYSYDSTFGAMDMCMLWMDNCYHFDNYLAEMKGCKTNKSSNTAMRTPGAAQGVFFMESIVEHVANVLQGDPVKIRELNFYKEGQLTPYQEKITKWNLPTAWSQVQESSNYKERCLQIQEFNVKNRWRKRGISLVPIKYGIAEAGYNQSVLLNICVEDGSVQITTSGTEMGQGLYTKTAQAAAYGLGIPLSLITVMPTSTEKTPNFGTTGGSGTSECCAGSALLAAKEMNERLKDIKEQNPKDSWIEILQKAQAAGILLSVSRQFNGAAVPTPFLYYCYGAGVTEIELDVLTGEIHVLRSDLVYDGGRPLNPKIDLGQIEGGFVMALGYNLTEEFSYDKSGNVSSLGTWEYKPPQSRDIPIEFNVDFVKNSNCPEGVLGSKASAEPPLLFANSIVFAAKNAILEARKQNTNKVDGSITLDLPQTVEKLQLNCLTDIQDFVLH